jgi:hypothetical protein
MSGAEDLEARHWLGWTLASAPNWAIDDGELLARLDVGLAGAEREETLCEIERRLTIWDVSRVDELSSLLGALEQRHRDPGSAAQNTDRLLQRLLHRLKPARALAELCVVSDRRSRRKAAWTYFGIHGCDPAVESVLVEQLRRHPLPEVVSLAVDSPEVLRHVPLAPLLARIDGYSWRGRVLEALLVVGADAEVLSVAARWPGEVVFAIRRAGRRDLVHLVRRLLDEHPDDPDLICGAMQAFGIFGQTDELLRTAAIARRVLGHVETRLAARFGFAPEDLVAPAM